MKSEKFNTAFNDINEEFLLESEEITEKHNLRVKKIRITSAGSLCLALCILLSVIHINKKEIKISENLPKISISKDLGSYGYEGYIAYDISELVNNNPWYEKSDIKTMPVFENKYAYDPYGETYMRTTEDIKLMKNKIYEVAKQLGVDKDKIKISSKGLTAEQIEQATEKYEIIGKDLPEDFEIPHNIKGEYKDITIDVDYSLRTIITFEPAKQLPDKYEFDYYMNYEDAYKTAKYLLKKYKYIFDFKRPMIDINGGDYNIYLKQQHSINIFDNSGSIQEKIVNYCLKNIRFENNEEGELKKISSLNCDTSDKIGDYPIITAKEAEEKLINGKYLTGVPEAFKDQNSIKKVELIYRNATWERYFIPYYRFYVELSETTGFIKENNLKTYGAYYVPAIEEKYISNLTDWDGLLH